MSDVPLGVFLSGGIDSTSIVACMARAAPGNVRTFSVAFDESTHFRRVARHFGTRHEERILTPDALLEILPELAEKVDEPFADASILPTFLLSRFTREHVTVALGGDGGDELLAGYPTYQAHRLAGLYERLPRAVRSHLVEPVIRRLPVSRANISFDFKAKRFVRGAGNPPEIRNQLWLGSFTGQTALGALHPDLRAEVDGADLFKEERRHMREAPGTDLLGKLQYVDLKMYLQDGIKYVFKRAMRPWLPPGIESRSKKGFGIPVAEWLRGPLKGMMLDLLAHDRLRRQGLLDPAAVGGLVDDHLSGRRDNRKQIWTLLMLQLWHDHWGRTDTREAVVA
jgi:asparagine synthase (glutamine-hydrolysing)